MNRIDDLFDLTALLSPAEIDWQTRARDLATTLIAPVIDADFENKHFRREIVAELGAGGFLGMHLTGYGCAGASAVSYGLACLEFEAVDSGWRTLVSVQGSLAMSAIWHFGSEQQKQEFLPHMATGAVLGCFALTEPHGGSDPAAMVTRADRDGDGWVITGTKRWIGLASEADLAIVWARTDEGIRGFIVPTDADGFVARPIDTKLSMRASVQCDVEFNSVRVSGDALLPGVTGLSAALSCLNEARFGIVWGVMGAARSCLNAAVTRSTERSVFGRPLGANQLVQQKLAEMFVEYEKGMLLALHIGRQKERGTLTPEQISVGKLNNVREAIAIASTARSLLGGDGITSEFPVMRHMANLESVRTYEGTDDIHTLILGRALTGLAAF
ncbi:acyl-CoA dehydrogenase family protein [Leifsonia kafniensis]|uniref:glutaryl-CoA dehydrogenase (ETF) n=1 Tax=Leifsonia kafniensis TaxID=475957 RepID=A0ABP7KGN4_9MICO